MEMASHEWWRRSEDTTRLAKSRPQLNLQESRRRKDGAWEKSRRKTRTAYPTRVPNANP